MNPTLAMLLTPFGMTMPRTARDLDRLIDRCVALKEANPTDHRLDPILREIGRFLCTNPDLDSAELPLAA